MATSKKAPAKKRATKKKTAAKRDTPTKRKPTPPRKFLAENYDAELWDREALASALELSRDPNATTRERNEALKTFAHLRKAIDTSPAATGNEPFTAVQAFLDEMRANA